MNCNCLTEIGEKLKEKNLEISGVTWLMPSFRMAVTINTAWIDKLTAPRGQKNSPPKMIATFCPFCGVKIENPKDETSLTPGAIANATKEE